MKPMTEKQLLVFRAMKKLGPAASLEELRDELKAATFGCVSTHIRAMRHKGAVASAEPSLKGRKSGARKRAFRVRWFRGDGFVGLGVTVCPKCHCEHFCASGECEGCGNARLKEV